MARHFSCLLLLLVAVGLATATTAAYPDAPVVNDRPVIGVLSLPNGFDQYKSEGRSYFASSYVKWLEAGGARVAPIVFTDSHEDITKLVNSLNGVLFTGGGASFVNPDGSWTPFAATGKLVLDLVMEANRNGEYMPLWATCMGFELLNVLVGGVPVLTAGFNSENLTLPLDLTPYAAEARMLANAPQVVNIVKTQAVTMNNHHSGVTPAHFYGSSNLTSTFHVVATNKDRDGNEFISTIEGKDMPLYSTQWHPEKVQFEWWYKEAMNHSPDSVLANSHFSHFFVNETRKNKRTFDTFQAQIDSLIYNYKPVFTGPTIGDFETCYFFD